MCACVGWGFLRTDVMISSSPTGGEALPVWTGPGKQLQFDGLVSEASWCSYSWRKLALLSFLFISTVCRQCCEVATFAASFVCLAWLHYCNKIPIFWEPALYLIKYNVYFNIYVLLGVHILCKCNKLLQIIFCVSIDIVFSRCFLLVWFGFAFSPWGEIPSSQEINTFHFSFGDILN